MGGWSVGIPILAACATVTAAVAGGLYLLDGQFWPNVWMVGTVVMGAGILSASRAAFRAGQQASARDKSV